MPLRWDDVSKDRKKLDAFFKFCKKEWTTENVMFTKLRLGPHTNFEDIYKKYIKTGSPREINIPHELKNSLEKLAKSKAWNDMLADLQQCQKETKNLLQQSLNRWERAGCPT